MHQVDLEEIRAAALSGLEPPKRIVGLTSEQKRLKSLERELGRKEKALAETAAL
ncbi:MAG: IS3 family transposase, partial [Myxococcales bacterium]|nr:IS3 family transposase [Myxococcales bacterium]